MHRGAWPPLYGAALVGPAVVVSWRQLPSAEIVDVSAGGGANDGANDGSMTRPVRPYLALEGSPAGWAGRVMQGDGTASAVAVRGGEADAQVIVIGPDALAVSAREDGMWALFRDRLVHWGERGEVRRKVALPSGIATAAMEMIGGERDAVWLVGDGLVWRVDGDGAMRGPYPWTRRPRGEALCQPIERAQTVECSRLDGPAISWSATGGAGAAALPVLTSRRGVTPPRSLMIAAAGLDAGQRSFAVTAEDGELAVWRQSVRGGVLEASPEGRRFSSELGLPEAVSIEGGEVAFYARGRRSAHHGAGPLVSIVDEERYRHEVFPSSWALSPRGAAAVWGQGEVAVATSGPDGIAVLPVSFAAP